VGADSRTETEGNGMGWLVFLLAFSQQVETSLLDFDLSGGFKYRMIANTDPTPPEDNIFCFSLDVCIPYLETSVCELDSDSNIIGCTRQDDDKWVYYMYFFTTTEEKYCTMYSSNTTLNVFLENENIVRVHGVRR